MKCVYDAKPARQFVTFCRLHVRHLKGSLASKPFVPEAWQMERIVCPLLGWKRLSDGTRLYRMASIWLPRKNGKTMLLAALMLFLLFLDNEPGAELYAAAADREQARVLFDLARHQVESNEILASMATPMRNAIVFHEQNSSLKVLSSDAGTKHGLNPHGCAIDELHAHKSRELFDVLVSGTGARRQPLVVIISTAGVYDEHSVGYREYSRAKEVLADPSLDPTLLVVIFEAASDDPWDAETTWYKANPGLASGHLVRIDYLREQCQQAKRDPALENRFRQLHLNQWTSQVTRWLSVDDWNACRVGDEQAPLPGDECILGIDFSFSTDLSAAVALFPRPEPVANFEEFLDVNTDGMSREEAIKEVVTKASERAKRMAAAYRVYIKAQFWKPKENLRQAGRADRADYEQWAKTGLLALCPGKTIDEEMIEGWIRGMCGKYAVRKIAFDPAMAAGVATRLERDHLPVVFVRQGFVTLGPAAKLFEGMISARRLEHGGHPAMSYCIQNVAVKSDDRGNIYPVKSKSRGRIDGVSATLTALAELMREPFKPVKKKTRGGITLL